MKLTLFIFTVCLVCLLLTACSRRDDKFRQKIPGTWTSGAGSGGMTINPDGSILLTLQKPNDVTTFAGTWQIKDGFFIWSLTNLPAPPSVERDRIISVDEHHLVIEVNGIAHNLKR